MDNSDFETKAIHGGIEPDPGTGATKIPIYQSAGFAHETAKGLEDTFAGREFGYFYSRVSNPTIAGLEKRLTAIDHALASVVVSSGMAAISHTILSLAKAGDNMVASKSLFGSSYYLFKGLITQCGIEVRFVDTTDYEAYEQAIDDHTQLIFIEAIGNPKLDVPDISVLASIANRHHIPLVVDSTFTTSYLVDAKALGAHILAYSTTKYLCGGGSTIGGVIVDLGTFNWKESRSSIVKQEQMFGDLAFISSARKVRSNVGGCQAPQNAFMTALGLETLTLRLEKHSQNALALANYFNGHPAVSHVSYPGLESSPYHEVATRQFRDGLYGGMVTIRVGSKENAYKVIDHLEMVRNLVNLGDSKTLVVHPSSTIYRRLSDEEKDDAGVYPDLIRISVGLESSKDIITDFKQALQKV